MDGDNDQYKQGPVIFVVGPVSVEDNNIDVVVERHRIEPGCEVSKWE